LARKIQGRSGSRELRSKLGLTQEHFAAKIGVTFSTVNRWESGKSKPSPLAMRQIEELFSEDIGE
jgi:DNA-binding transcriptional regulator YiaG